MKDKIFQNVVLSNTNNVGYKNLEGTHGELSFDNGNCKFEYISENGKLESISFPVKGKLGELGNHNSKEIFVLTSKAQYAFDQIPLHLQKEVPIPQFSQQMQYAQPNPQIITSKEYSNLTTDFTTIRRYFEHNKQDTEALKMYNEAKSKFDDINQGINAGTVEIVPVLNSYVAKYLDQTALEQGEIGGRFEFKKIPNSDLYALYALNENGEHGQDMSAVYDLRDNSLTFNNGITTLEATLEQAKDDTIKDNDKVYASDISR